MGHKTTALAALTALLVGATPAMAQDVSSYDANGDGVLDVQILYDNTGPFSDLGLIYAEMLMNLLGHFDNVEPWAVSTGEYQAGDLLTNELTFYIGATYDGPIPDAMVSDFNATDRPIVWFGYNLWKIGWNDWNGFLAEYGFQHWYIAGNDGTGENTDFYRYVQYKGTELPKFAWWNEESQTFLNDPFVAIHYFDDPEGKIEVLGEIVHSGTGDVQPWVMRSGNLTVVNEMPFTYIHEQDRYVGFADMVHDLVGIDHEASQSALFRLEDVHPKVAASDINLVKRELKRGIKRPWSIALVPAYEDPLGYYNNGTPESFTMNSSQARAWRRQINSSMRNGASLVLHGYTHQYGDIPNPYNGVSGDDFEFWMLPADTPVPEDSYEWFTGRIDDAEALMDRRSWEAFAWEVPHYRASVADYLWTNDRYDTTYHRVVYHPFEVELWGTIYTHNEIFEDPQSVQDWSAANVLVAGDRWGGQFFPYVIERDVYGNRVLPETMGNLEPAEFALGPQYVRLVDDLLANAEKNLVNRCAYASFFYHPYLMQFPEIEGAGGPEALRALITGLENMGYTFVAAKDL